MDFSDVMYGSLPDHVLHRRTKFCLKDIKSKQLLSVFLRRHATKRLIEEGVEDDLKLATLSLESTIIRSKTKKLQRKRKRLSTKEFKKLTKITAQDAVFDLYMPLHNLWYDYINDAMKFDSLADKNVAEIGRRLVNIDLHGAILHVAKSKSPSLVGISGILLQERKNVFILVTAGNELKTVPKQNAVFTLSAGGHEFTIYGNNIRMRPSERCIASFKSVRSIDL